MLILGLDLAPVWLSLWLQFYLFSLCLLLSSASFFSHCVVLFDPLFHFLESWPMWSTIFVVSEIILFSRVCVSIFCFFHSFSSVSFYSFIVVQVSWWLFLLIILVFAWDQFCLPRRVWISRPWTPPFFKWNTFAHLSPEIGRLDADGVWGQRQSLFSILLSGRGGRRREAKPPGVPSWTLLNALPLGWLGPTWGEGSPRVSLSPLEVAPTSSEGLCLCSARLRVVSVCVFSSHVTVGLLFTQMGTWDVNLPS